MLTRRSMLGGAAAVAATATRAPALSMPSLPAGTDAAVRRAMEDAGIPGLGLAVHHNGRRWAGGFGVADASFGVSVTADTAFALGSVAKHVTALAVLRLVDTGKLGLHDPIGAIVPGLPAAWQPLRLHDLLHHTAGLVSYTSDPGYQADRPYTRPQVIALAADKPLLFPAGEGWSYSNTGYLLLGWALEERTGQPYRAVIDTLLRTSGLRRSRVDDAGAVIPGRATGYAIEGGQLRRALVPDAGQSGWADGGVLMSPADAVAWFTALIARSPPEMFTAGDMGDGVTAPYGTGWFLEDVPGHRLYWHTGGVPGFTTAVLLAPAHDLAVAVFTNVEMASAPQRQIAQIVAEALAPGATPLGRTIPDRSPQLTAVARTILLRGDAAPDPALFAPALAARIKARGPGAVLALAVPGGLTAFEIADDWREGGMRWRRYRARVGAQVHHFRFGYDGDGRIFWLFFG